VIRVERREGGIGWITVDRPAARNAMTFAMWRALRDGVRELDADDGVRAVVIASSASEAFIAGTDIAEFRAFEDAGDGVAYEHRIDEVITAIEDVRVPTVAAIAGACTGGGVSVALACDLRIGAANARVGIPIARTLGNCISLKTMARAGAVLGLDAVKRLIFSAELLDAPAALRAGFLSEILPENDTLHARATDVATGIASRAPLTLKVTKEMARRIRRAAPLPSDEDLVRICYGSDDFREGLTSFLDKRRPRWSGT